MRWTTFSTAYGLWLLFCLPFISGGGIANHGQQNAVASKHAFSNKLFKAVAEEHKKDGTAKNLIMSPLSLEIILSAAGMGARGKTQEEIAVAVGSSLELETMKQRYAPVVNGLQSDGITFRVATNMFVQEQYNLRQNFVNSSRDVFACGVDEVNFIAHPDKAVTTINSWVYEKTRGLIKEIVTSGTITAETRLVLANAVYFKGKWAHPFDKRSTHKERFHLVDGRVIDVDMMSTDEVFRYGYVQELGTEVLELPYQGNELSMVILLPFADSSIYELGNKVSSPGFDLSKLLTNYTHEEELRVIIPKFNLELTTSLEKILAKMGMVQMFTDKADFSGMTDSVPGLKVDNVVQKAFIEVNEEGTEAAAATEIEFIPVRMPHTFFANRPFIFFLWNKTSRLMLFSGQLTSP